MVDRLLAENSLAHYVKQAWKVVEPKRELKWNWHMDVICQHLEAVTNTFIMKGDVSEEHNADLSIPPVNYLWINVPPRHTKSLLVSVFWPTWEWGPKNLPQLKYIFGSYSQDLSTRDSLRRRRIIQSRWYQNNWGERFHFVNDQNAKTRFENNHTGYCIATSTGGIGTGEGGDRIVVDDAHNVKDVESDTKREAVLSWWDESMPTRLDDEDSGAYIGIMQRTHQKDLSGHVIEKWQKGEIELDLICLPARYEPDHPTPSSTSLDFRDPRTEMGEPLDQFRYPEPKLKSLSSRMTAWANAGQLQQRPTVRGGQIFPVANIQVVDDYSEQNIRQMVRYWDKAGTEGGGKRTAGVKIARMKRGRYDYLILDVVKGQWEYGNREKRIHQVAQTDGRKVRIYVEQEPGSGGKESVQNTIRRTLQGYSAYADRATGDKFVRMEPLAAAVENGRVAVLNRPWTKEYLDEMENAGPGAAFVDQADSTAGGFNRLNDLKEAGVWGK